MDGRENFYQRLLNDAGVKTGLGGGNIPEIVGRIKIRSTKSFFERSILERKVTLWSYICSYRSYLTGPRFALDVGSFSFACFLSLDFLRFFDEC